MKKRKKRKRKKGNLINLEFCNMANCGTSEALWTLSRCTVSLSKKLPQLWVVFLFLFSARKRNQLVFCFGIKNLLSFKVSNSVSLRPYWENWMSVIIDHSKCPYTYRPITHSQCTLSSLFVIYNGTSLLGSERLLWAFLLQLSGAWSVTQLFELFRIVDVFW